MKAITAFCLAVCIAGVAYAGPTIRLSDGLTTLQIADGDPSDINPFAGTVTYAGSVGPQWLFSVTSGVSVVSPVNPQLDLVTINATNVGGGGVLDILLTDTSFSFGGFAAIAQFIGEIGGNTDGSVQWWMFVDDGNTAFAETTLIGTGTSAGSPFAAAFSGSALVDDLFAMTLHVRIQHLGAGPETTGLDFFGSGRRVPEPDTGTLLLVAALASLVAGRRMAVRT